MDFNAESVMAPKKSNAGISSCCGHLCHIGHWLDNLTSLFHLLPITLLVTPILQIQTQRFKVACPLSHLK